VSSINPVQISPVGGFRLRPSRVRARTARRTLLQGPNRSLRARRWRRCVEVQVGRNRYGPL
jgi:hypothetical protein